MMLRRREISLRERKKTIEYPEEGLCSKTAVSVPSWQERIDGTSEQRKC